MGYFGPEMFRVPEGCALGSQTPEVGPSGVWRSIRRNTVALCVIILDNLDRL